MKKKLNLLHIFVLCLFTCMCVTPQGMKVRKEMKETKEEEETGKEDVTETEEKTEGQVRPNDVASFRTYSHASLFSKILQKYIVFTCLCFNISCMDCLESLRSL